MDSNIATEPGVGIFVNPKPGAANNVFTAAGLFLAMVWLTLSLRIWVRVNLAKSFDWDDAILILSALTFTGFCTVIILAGTIGGFPHVHDMGIPALSWVVGMIVATFGLYISTMVIFKISLGIFYLRFITRHWQRVLIYTTVASNTLYGLLLFFVAIFQCGDPTLYLTNELKAICMPNGPLFGIQLAGAIINATTDCILALLPILVLAKANMPTRTKFSAGFVLLLGCSGSIISLIRIQYIKDLRPSPNFFRGVIDIAIWSIAECGICISAAAAAALRPLFRGLVERTGISVSNILSLGSRAKIEKGIDSNVRQSETMFGDWGLHTARHQMTDIETPTEEFLHGSPVIYQYQVPDKMSSLEDDPGKPHERTTATVTSEAATPTVPRTFINDVRLKNIASQVDKRAYNDLANSPKRCEIIREPGIRDKQISRPMPRSSSPMVPPTPTFGERPQRVLRVDSRRRGNPDWGQAVHPLLSPNAIPKSPLSPTGTLF